MKAGRGVQRIEPQDSEPVLGAELPSMEDDSLSLEQLGKVYADMLSSSSSVPASAASEDQLADDSASTSQVPNSAAGSTSEAADTALNVASKRLVSEASKDELAITPERIVEALLFVGQADTKPLTSNQIASTMRGVDADEIPGFVDRLNQPGGEWQLGGMAGADHLGADEYPDHPVFNVTVTEAYQCARWMKGLLPTTDQWDAAAGLDRPGNAQGPFIGNWTSEKPLDIAVGRRDLGPAPIGSCRDDISLLGVRDLAGNGHEWTRNIYRSSKTVPLDEPDFVFIVLRSQSYLDDEPLVYRLMANEDKYEIEPYRNENNQEKSRPDISFRVVLELP